MRENFYNAHLKFLSFLDISKEQRRQSEIKILSRIGLKKSECQRKNKQACGRINRKREGGNEEIEEESNVRAKRCNNEHDKKKREKLKAGGRERERWDRDEAKKARRVKATCTAKTTRFNETVGTSGLRGAPERREASALRVCTARPYFNREIRTKRGKEGYTGRDARRGGGGQKGEEKKRETVRAKEVRKPKVEGYRRKGEYKARYASQAAVIVEVARVEAGGSPTTPPFVPSCFLSLSLPPRMISPSLLEKTREDEEREKNRQGKRREEGRKEPSQ